MSDNSNEFGAFMSGLLLGGIAGAITALLLAPQSGEETRKVIIDKSVEIKDKALETVEETRLRAEKAAEDARAAAGITAVSPAPNETSASLKPTKKAPKIPPTMPHIMDLTTTSSNRPVTAVGIKEDYENMISDAIVSGPSFCDFTAQNQLTGDDASMPAFPGLISGPQEHSVTPPMRL